MNGRKCYTIVVALLMTILSASAQDNSPRQIYEQAEAEYQIGRILIAKNLLESCVHNLNSTYRLSGYRLMSLCCLALDETEEARHYAELVLKENPYYTPTVEYPPRFIDLINEIKQGFTITTASSQSESISEAPTPVTIITAEMIEELGYNKSLNQILAAYVPGMVEMTPNKDGENLAMHGAYSFGQDMIMIMENGHRLNNRYNNIGRTDYIISTEKIDHIEVLRGPASSLYGNVALTAVVNIITKSGGSINGVQAKYGYGTFNTHRGDLLLGTQFLGADITAWASIYRSDGQVFHFRDGEGYFADMYENRIQYLDTESIYFGPDKIYVGKYSDPPSYDLGLNFKLKDFRFMFSRKKGNKATAMASVGSYEYNDVPSVKGYKPGFGIDETHVTVGYTHQFKKLSLDAQLYSDWYSHTYYYVYFDSMIARKVETGEIIESMKGYSSFDNAKENSYGGLLKASTNYQIGGMRGQLLAGGQYDHFALDSRLSIYVEDPNLISNGSIFPEDIGKESYLSFFVQDKHYILPQLILNAGIRYDIKYRHDKDAFKHFSPRLALMYVPSDLFSLKLSYSEAFSDLAYYYRLIFTGISNLDPQKLSALQLTAMGRIAPMHLNYEVNLFYNHYSHLFCLSDRSERYNDEKSSIGNDGVLKNVGIEGTVHYAHNRLSGNLMFYYCHNLSAKDYYFNNTENKVNNVPHITLNLHGAWKLLQGKNHELKVYGTADYRGRSLTLVGFEDQDFYTDPSLIFDLGLKYQYRQHLSLAIDVENILNTDHYICGLLNQNAPMFQRGRTLMGSISFAF